MAPASVTEFLVKSHDAPDESRRPDKGQVDVVRVDDFTLARLTFQPGWRWSESIKPIVKTESCQVNHVGHCVSGSLEVQLNDGAKATVTAGESYTIPAGHDAWVIGDEPFVGIEFAGAEEFARPAD